MRRDTKTARTGTGALALAAAVGLTVLGCLHSTPRPAASGPSGAGATAPGFSGTIATYKMGPAPSAGRVLALLWDPHRAGDPAPSRDEVEQRLFGAKNSVADWFRENSGGRFRMEKAGCLGWYAAKKPAEHYWETSAAIDSRDSDGDGWLNGHVEKWVEAIRDADPEFNYATFDTNRNRVLEASELAVLVVIPQNQPFGTVRGVAGREFPTVEPLIVDGVRIDSVSEWYTGEPLNWPTAAHELSHFLLDAPDLYSTQNWPFCAGSYSIMDVCYASVHLDPFVKLKLGWLDVRVVTQSGDVTLRDVETHHEALVLYDPEHGKGEYFLIEYRRPTGTYDEGVASLCSGVSQAGLAVWHIVEDPALLARARLPDGVSPGEWGRGGIRLIRANGGTPIDDANALFTTPGAVLSDDSTPARLRWADGSATGFTMTLLTPPGESTELGVRVTRTRGQEVSSRD